MTTRVFDIATLLKAFGRLSDEVGGSQWLTTGGTHDEQQRHFLDLCGSDRPFADQLNRLDVECSPSYTVLNNFLAARGFKPCFREIGRGGIGVAAVLDMLVEWLLPGSLIDLCHFQHSTRYAGFELSNEGVQLYTVLGYDRPVARIMTKSGDYVWLAMTAEPSSELEMVQQARRLLTASLTPCYDYTNVQVPMIDIDAQVDLNWLLGMNKGDHSIDQAFQLLKLRMNETGACVKAATGLVTERSAMIGSGPLKFNQPFLLFFTQPGIHLPIATCYVNTDSWRRPAATI